MNNEVQLVGKPDNVCELHDKPDPCPDCLAEEARVSLSRPMLDETKIAGRVPVELTPDPVMQSPDVRHDTEARLSSGLTAKQLVNEARAWWNGKGRRAMADNRKSQVKRKRGQRTQRGPFTLDIDDPNFLPSGILHALEWDQLTKDECVRVVRTYHEMQYLRPMRAAGVLGKGGVIIGP